MSEYQLLIAGELVDGVNTLDVINPATEEVIGQCPLASEAQLNAAVAAAKRATDEWRQTSSAVRSEKLRALAAAIEDNGDELAHLLTLEQGKPLAKAQEEVFYSQVFINHFADNGELPVELVCEDENQRVELHREPLGVVAGICPWNFPLLIAAYKIAPSLMAGNCIIIKPAPSTPLTTLKLGSLITGIFPAGVISIIADDNDLGPLMTSHADIAKISFTGSTATGKKIMANAANTLKRTTLELGGNDAAIVLDDINPKQAAEHIFGAAFMNSGQVCIALKRLYVHESIYDELCDEIAELANNAIFGNGLEAASQFGPVQNRMQYQKVCGFIADAKVHGNVIAGGDIPDQPGFFVPLTVVRDIEDGTRVVDEEPFGPVLPIIKYSDIDAVIKQANASPYGLGGSIWSEDIERAREIADRIHVGTLWINQHCAFGPNIPLPAAKQSGIGVEHGTEGLLEYTRVKVVSINKAYP